MNFRSSSSKRNTSEAKFELFHIRLIARLCIGFACFVYFLSRLATIKGIIRDNSSSAVVNRLSLAFAPIITIIVLVEYLLFKKKGKKILKYSEVIDILILLLFTADWIIVLVSTFTRAQEMTLNNLPDGMGPPPGPPPGGDMGNPPPMPPPPGSGPDGLLVSFPVTALYEFASFAWKALLVTLIIQRWQLKIIPPAAAIITSTVYACHFDSKQIHTYLIRASAQLFNTVFIIYCEDKIKWKMIWNSIQQEKWMQVNDFILNNLPENIMILDVAGQVKFISDYCKSFMEKCQNSLETTELFNNIRDLQQQKYDTGSPGPPPPHNSFTVERLATGNNLLTEVAVAAPPENNQENIKVDILTDLITNFKEIIKEKNLQEKQFLIYNGRLKTENQPDKAIEIKVSFIQHFENEYIILILRDTTQRDQLVALEETNKYKDQLLASVSHELRAPLNGNINLVEGAIASPKIPGHIKETLLTPALRSSKFLLHIINDILDMSQIKEKKLRLTFENKDLREAFKSTASLVELQAKKKGIDLILEFDPNLPKKFCTDHVRVSQIVLNLMNNAMKFTKEGAIKLVATMTSEPSWIKVSVIDSGIGMTQENVKKLFSDYTHIEFEGRQAMNPTGVGLGLNIAYKLVQLLAPKNHQTISVESVPDQGSTFSFILENQENDDDPQQIQEPGSNDSEKSQKIADELSGEESKLKLYSKLRTLTSEVSIRNKSNDDEESLLEPCLCPRVLIVDDNPFNTMAFETILSSLDVQCESVFSGRSGIEKLLNRETKRCGKDCNSYSVVFMDQEMPEMSGSETVKEIRRLQREKMISSEIKIIGCTAHHSKEEIDKFVAAGLDKCIHKPISAQVIKDIL